MSSGDPYWLRTKWAGTCSKCEATIPKGKRAFYYPKGKRLYCADDGCGGQAARDFAATVQDEAVYDAQYGGW